MLKKISTFFLYLLLLLSAGLFFAYEKYPAVNLAVKQTLGIAPCQKPLVYSLGTFDLKFNITDNDFLSAIDEASKIWNTVAGKTLFIYSPDGKLKINLIYDYRQDATDKLKDLGFTIDNTKSSYDRLKSEYERRLQIYNADKAKFEQLVNKFQTQKEKYDSDVAYWNSRGGAPKKNYDSLQVTRSDLQSLAQEINRDQSILNNEIDELNAIISSLNKIAKEINLGVQTYNKIGQSTGEEFSEGLYVYDASGAHIDVYQFNDRAQLVRLLTHELGHAIGLEHVDEPNAIMYRLNESENLTPTQADISELKTICNMIN